MPRVVLHTPEWLRRPSPGYDLFSRSPSAKHTKIDGTSRGQPISQNLPPPPSRKIAARGTQVFVAVHNELRWSDLVGLKEQKEGGHDRLPFAQSIEGDTALGYRVLKVPVHDEIQQLVLSPNASYLAIATAHTVHIALLPDPYHLSTDDAGPIKLKTFQVGPTTHIVGQSPLVSVLWHPLGVDGSCLTTITEDATVRLWEFDINNRMSVNGAALALDLKRLANGVSSSEDFSPSKFGAVSFSAELPYMEVAAACYGGAGGSDLQRDSGWATCTLWIGMKDGGLYSLSPLLPSKFAASPKWIDELAASACLKAGELDEGGDGSKESLRRAVEQLNWINGIEKNHRGDDYDVNLTIFNRPGRPGPLPMLQGPYHVEPDPDALFDITDLFAIPQTSPKEGSEDSFEMVGGDEEEQTPVSTLCVATSDGLVHICFDLKGTEGRWLPARKIRDDAGVDESALPELLLMESLEVDRSPTLGRPMFTADPLSRAAFFVTHSQGVTHVSIGEMMDRILDETEGSADAGGSFRLKLAMEDPLAVESELIRLPRPLLGPESISDTTDTRRAGAPSACVALCDSELGDMIVTESNSEPFSAQLDYSDLDLLDDETGGDEDMEGYADEIVAGQARETYQPAHELYEPTALFSVMKHFAERNPRRSMSEAVRISNLDLDMMTQAHHVLAQETHRINDAVSRLFGRTERLQQEYRAQLERAHEAQDKIEAVVDDDADVLEPHGKASNTVENIERRMEDARVRQAELQDRFEKLRADMESIDKRPLNSKEKEWMRQVEEIGASAEQAAGTREGGEAQVWQRVGRVREWKEQLVEQSKEAWAGDDDDEEGSERQQSSPASRRRVGSAGIRNMLERERAMVEATRKKLDELMSVKLTD